MLKTLNQIYNNRLAKVDNGVWFKSVRTRMAKFDTPNAGTPTGGTRDAYAKPPTREDLDKTKDWKRRRWERRQRDKGKAGMLDPREKTNYNIKPSGHAGGG